MLNIKIKEQILMAIGFFLFVPIITSGQELSYPRVTGKVVDETGKAVPFANAYIHPVANGNSKTHKRSSEAHDSLVVEAKADSSGKLEFYSHGMERVIICITYPSKTKSYSPIGEIIGCKSSIKNTFNINKSNDTHLGELSVTSFTNDVLINLKDTLQDDLYICVECGLWLKVYDSSYTPTRHSFEKIPENAISSDRSSILLHLPAGKWFLEFAVDENFEKRSSMQSVVIPKKRTDNLVETISIHFPAKQEVGCPESKSDTEAKQKLKSLGISYDLMSFFSAGFNGNEKVTRLFLGGGFDPNMKMPNGGTTLMGAIRHIEIVKLLVSCGANVNLITDNKESALMFASIERREDTVSFLLQQKADINLQDIKGKTALMYAVESNSEEIVGLLLKNGADKTLKKFDGKTAYEIAINMNNKEIIQILK